MPKDVADKAFAALVKAAANADVIRARMEKTAIVGWLARQAGRTGLGRGVGRLFGRAPGPVPRIASPLPRTATSVPTPAVPGPRGRFGYSPENEAAAFAKATTPPPVPTPRGGPSLRSILGGTAAAGGTGAVGLGHLSNQADSTPDTHWYNPFTWSGNRPSAEDIFKRNNQQYEEMTSDLRNQIVEALGRGDVGEAERLQQQLDPGNFGGSFWRLGGLNPFARQRAGFYQGNAAGAQQRLQTDYNTEVGKAGMQPGDHEKLRMLEERLSSGAMLPSQAALLQRQMEALRQKMLSAPGTENEAAKAIRARMEGAGMRLSGRPAGALSSGTTGTWATGAGRRPATSGLVHGYALNPFDFRRDDPRVNHPWEASMLGPRSEPMGF